MQEEYELQATATGGGNPSRPTGQQVDERGTDGPLHRVALQHTTGGSPLAVTSPAVERVGCAADAGRVNCGLRASCVGGGKHKQFTEDL